MIPYLNPGDPLAAAQWAALFQAADAVLTNALGGLSAVLAASMGNGLSSPAGQSIDSQFDRGFFFFDPLSVAPASLHPAVPFFLSHYWGNVQGPQQVMFLRQYNHAAVTALVNGLTTNSTSQTYGVALLAKPSWATWSAAVYPDGFAGYSTANMFSGTTPADNILDCSLGVIRVAVGGAKYAVTFKDVTTAEHAQPLKPIDVFINANLTWDDVNWDKYSIVRAHNCGRNPAAIFGATIAPGASRCFRKISGVWQAQGNYFHWMHPGDGRFLKLRSIGNDASGANEAGGTSPLFFPSIIADIFSLALGFSTSNFGRYFDPLKFWDASPILNNASYQPTGAEKAPPAGGYFAPAAAGSLLGDLMVHRGKVMAFQGNSNHPMFSFAGFGSLSAALAAAGVGTRAITQDISAVTGAPGSVTNLEIYAANWHLVDLTCPLATFLTAGVPAVVVGSSQTSAPKSLTLPWLVFGAVDLQPATATTGYSYQNYAIDDGGNFYTTTTVNVSVLNHSSTSALKKNVFLPTQSVASVAAWLATICQAGGMLQTQNVQVLSTAFGAVLQWDEIWPVDATFTAIFTDWATVKVFTTKVVLDQSAGTALRVTRTVFLNDTPQAGSAAVFPPRAPASKFSRWNYPRIDQLCQMQRFFLHATADAPFMPDWSANFSGSHYASAKFVSALYPCYNDPLSTDQWNTVTSFYETKPIGVDVPAGNHTYPKTGISRMGAWTPDTDAWGPFAAWVGGAGSFNWSVAPDLSGAVSSVSLLGGNLIANLESSGAASSSQVTPNALPCQAEHFNAIASLINGQPPMKVNPDRLAFAGSGRVGTAYTLNFAAANIIITNGGSGHSVGDSLNFNLKVGSVDSHGGITSVMQNGAVIVNTHDAYSTPRRPFSLDGGSATCDTAVGDGSQLSFLPNYTPIGVATPPSGTWATAWPRNAFFAWNGPTPGGADPVGTYLATLAGGTAVQSSLPDNYGTPMPLYEYMMEPSGNITSTTISGYAFGCDAAFQIQASTYRWITIDAARVIYNAFSAPFSLNQTCLPMKWAPTNIAGTLTSTTSNTGMAGSGGDMGAVNSWVADFFTDPAGNWLRTYDSANLCAASSPCAEPFRYVVNNGDSLTAVEAYGFPYGEFTPTKAAFYANTFFPTGPWSGTLPWRDLSYAWLFGGPTGPLKFYLAVNLPQKPLWGRSAAVFLREGLPDLCVMALPQNAIYYDTAWAVTNVNAIHDLGTGIVPIIADNTVENSPSEVTVIPGAGGAAKYDHVFTTTLLNARLVTIPVDGALQPINPAPSANGI